MEAKPESPQPKDEEEDFNQQIENFSQLVGNIVNAVKTGAVTEDTMVEYLFLLHDAIMADDTDKVAELAKTGMDVNEKFDSRVNTGHAGISPLALASALNKPQLVKILIDNGADVNLPFAALNTTALMTSCYHGHVEVVRLLIGAGADVNMVDLQQSTALGYAFGGTRDLRVIEMLLDAGIDVNTKNMLGMNALLLVAGYGNPELVKMILDSGANPNDVNDFGHTALHLAVVGKHDMLKKFKKFGSAEAVAADRSLNRRNLDVAIQEWARLHKDAAGGTKEDQAALARAGRIMMSIGHQLEDTPVEDGEEQDGLQRRVQAVWKHRQTKMRTAKEKKKGGIWNLLGCGGGKSKEASADHSDDRPYTALPASPDKVSPEEEQPDNEVSQVSVTFARILRMFIDAGCEIDQPDRTFGMTALDLAILNGDVESSAVLASLGADPNHFLKMLALKELYQSIVTGQKKEVKDLLMYDEDLDINVPFSRFNVDAQSEDEGITALTLAVREGDIETIKLLLKKGAFVNMSGPSGRFPLTEAACKGHRKVTELLLSNAANIEQPSSWFREATPLTVAVIFKQHDLVKYLIKRGAKVDKRLSDGNTPLLIAFKNDDMEMLGILLEADLTENFSEKHGQTAELAKSYQSKERDVEGILAACSESVSQLEDQSPNKKRNSARDLVDKVQADAQAELQRAPHSPTRKAPSPPKVKTSPKRSKSSPKSKSETKPQTPPETPHKEEEEQEHGHVARQLFAYGQEMEDLEQELEDLVREDKETPVKNNKDAVRTDDDIFDELNDEIQPVIQSVHTATPNIMDMSPEKEDIPDVLLPHRKEKERAPMAGDDEEEFDDAEEFVDAMRDNMASLKIDNPKAVVPTVETTVRLINAVSDDSTNNSPEKTDSPKLHKPVVLKVDADTNGNIDMEEPVITIDNGEIVKPGDINKNVVQTETVTSETQVAPDGSEVVVQKRTVVVKSTTSSSTNQTAVTPPTRIIRQRVAAPSRSPPKPPTQPPPPPADDQSGGGETEV